MLGRGHDHRRSRGLGARRLQYEPLEARVVLSIDSPVADIGGSTPAIVAEVEPVPAAAISIADWVLSLHYTQFNQLIPEHLPYLSTLQLASIPDIYWFARMSPAVRAALAPAQVRALDVGEVHLDYLTATQVSWLTVAQIQSLGLYDFKFLWPSQIPSLTPAQIATIPDPGPWAEWTPAARAALTQPQVQALRVSTIGVGALTPQQIGWLTVVQIWSLQLHDFKYLAPSQIPSLTTAQIATIPDPGPWMEWTAAARAALTQPQVRALRVANVSLSALTAVQVSWLTVAQIQSLLLFDFEHLSPSQIPSLTPAQIATIPDPGPMAEWTAAARAALTPPQIQSLRVATVRLGLLTAQQIGWLTIAQLQSLHVDDVKLLTPYQTTWLLVSQIRLIELPDFKHLAPSIIPFLTPAQIASIPDPGPLAEWSAEARAALTLLQVQALRVSTVGLGALAPQQIAWLTAAQIQSLQLHDWKFLAPSQVPFLTPAQIALIPNPGPLAAWTPAARAALTPAQVRAIRVATVGLGALTPPQIGWLTVAQIQSLLLADFQALAPSQIPLLTPAQIATIPDPGPFSEWSAAARAAITQLQVPALRVADLGLDFLTTQQIGWLSIAQIKALRWEDISRLYDSQIPFLTAAQFAQITGVDVLPSMTDAALARITREQFLALQPHVLAAFTRSVIPPSNYVPTIDIPVGPDGIAINHLLHDEAQHVFDLVPLAAATHVTVASGNWSDPNVWQGGRVPTLGARVVVSAGNVVRFDPYMTADRALQTLRIDGTLSFATNVNTQLMVDTIVVHTAGKLHIGTAAAPIAANVTARILIPDGAAINTVWDPYLLSRGLISQGEVRMYGKTVTPYTALSRQPVRGDSQLVLAEAPQNWKVGDKIVLTGTLQYVDGNLTEERMIRAINGNVVTIDALLYDHVPPAGFGLSVYVANYARNIVIASAADDVPAQRPHMMFMHNPNVQIENISVFGFGRSDKSVPLKDAVVVNGVLQQGTGTNQRARYPMHFHHTGVNPAYAPAVVRGSIIAGSPGWGYVNHSSNVVMENNVAYDAYGASFVSEDGNEIGVMRGNLSVSSPGTGAHVEARMLNHDFGHSGHGFWLQGPGVAVIDNIAAGNQDAAFMYFTTSGKAQFDAVNLDNPAFAAGRKTVPVGVVPIKEFSGNIAMTSKSGLEFWFHQHKLNDGESVVENFTSWNTRNTGINTHYTGQLTIRDSVLVGNMEKFQGVGVGVTHETRNVTIQNVIAEGFDVGILAPSRGQNVIAGGALNAVEGIHIDGAHDTIRTLSILGPVNFKTATAAQLSGRVQYRVYMSGRVDFGNRSLEAMLSTDRVVMYSASGKAIALYSPEQLSTYIPFPRETSLGLVPAQYLDLTNAELRARFGVSLGGELAPADVVNFQGYRALLDLSPGKFR